MGYIYPTEDKIIKFLNKLKDISFDKDVTWEKEIINFFLENPFVVYVIGRDTKDNYEYMKREVELNFLARLSQGSIIFDTEELYKSLYKINESIKIDNKLFKKYIAFFFLNSVIIRKMYGKVIDSEDSGFVDYKSKVMPFQYVLNYDNGNKVNESSFIICSDGSIDYNFDSMQKEVSKSFDEKLKTMLKKLENKDKNKKKRRPLDTRLRHECFKRDNYKCKECGATNVESVLHADHILPVAQGGTDELSNLQTLCEKCNLAKSDKSFIGGKNE